MSFLEQTKQIFDYNKEMLKDIIEASLLEDIFDCVTNDDRFLSYLENTKKEEKIFFNETIFVTKICKMIAMNHYTEKFIYGLNKVKIREKEYKRKIAEDVLKMIPLERLACYNCNNRSFEIYIPIIFYVSGMNNFLGNKFDEFQSKGVKTEECYNSDFNFSLLYKIIFKIKSCITLVDIRATDELITIFRTLIEMFMIYLSLWNESETAIKSFKKHDNLGFDFNYSKPIPPEIIKEAKKNNVDLIEYINYGWLIKLKNFKKRKNTKFNLRTLARYLDKKYDYLCKNIGSRLYTFYKMCNPQTHGTLDLMNYFQLELFIFQNIAQMLLMLSHFWCNCLIDFECDYKDINLDDRLSCACEDANVIYDFVNSNEIFLRETNEDFKNRCNTSFKIG